MDWTFRLTMRELQFMLAGAALGVLCAALGGEAFMRLFGAAFGPVFGATILARVIASRYG